MASEEPCCAAAAARMVKKLTLPNGSQVGIANLEGILKEVAELKLADNEAITKGLLKRIRIHNYVAPAAEKAYAEVLFKEYQRQAQSRS